MKTEEYAEKRNNKFDGQIEVIGTYVTGRIVVDTKAPEGVCGFGRMKTVSGPTPIIIVDSSFVRCGVIFCMMPELEIMLDMKSA